MDQTQLMMMAGAAVLLLVVAGVAVFVLSQNKNTQPQLPPAPKPSARVVLSGGMPPDDVYVTQAPTPVPKPGCPVTEEYAPVCGGGTLFSNASAARCGGYADHSAPVNVGGRMTCPATTARPTCMITKDWAPVCVGARMFVNSSAARCAGHTKFTPTQQDKCVMPKPCVATREFQPVCANGEVYDNRSAAACAGQYDTVPALVVDGKPRCPPGNSCTTWSPCRDNECCRRKPVGCDPHCEDGRYVGLYRKAP